MSTTPERMSEICEAISANLSGTRQDADFSDFFADEVRFWTCYGDDMDWLGTATAHVVSYLNQDVLARVAGDSVVVQLLHNARKSGDKSGSHECWIFDVKDGKIVGLNAYRDMASHTGSAGVFAEATEVPSQPGDLGRMVVRVRSAVETEVPAENMVQ